MIYKKECPPEEWQAFIATMHSGKMIEIDSEIYYYFLEVIPPIFTSRWVTFVPGFEGHKMLVDFGFAEGAEKIILFWFNTQQQKFYCQQSAKINPYA